MKHHVATQPTDAALSALKDDPVLKALYKTRSIADLNSMIAGMTSQQRQAALESLLKLAWVTIRQLR